MHYIKEYYRLAKPGIIYGNLLTTIAAFLFASRWQFSPHVLETFVAAVFGLGFVIGSGCVFNNYLDRHIDARMERTQKRALVSGRIRPRNALIFGGVCGIVGFAILWLHVNPLTAYIALFGWLMYVIVYGYAKRTTHWAAVVGAIPGAVPIVVGYTARTNHFDAAALLLFAILFIWQLPHFYAIAMYRLDEYVAAGIPVLPARKGLLFTRISIIAYIALFTIAVSLLTVFGYAGYLYLIAVLLLGIEWLVHALRRKPDGATQESAWARGVFLQSLIVLLVFSCVLAVSPLLPPL